MTTPLTRRTLLKSSAGLAGIALPLQVGAQPPQEGFFLLTNPTTDSLTFFKNETAESVPVAPSPWGVADGPGDRAYISSAQYMTIVNTANLTISGNLPYRTLIESAGYGEYRSGGMGIAATPDGKWVAVGINMNGSNGVVELYDVEQDSFVATVPVGVRPFDVVVSPDSSTVYSIDHDSFTITAIDIASQTAATIDAAPLGDGEFDKPHYAAVKRDGTLVLPYSGRLLWMLDPLSGESTSLPLTSNTHQHGIALSADETASYIVGTGPAGPSDGPPSLTILDLESGEETIVVLEFPHEQVALTEDGKTAILTGGYTFADGGWDGITRIDLETGAVESMPMAGMPLGITRIN